MLHNKGGSSISCFLLICPVSKIRGFSFGYLIYNYYICVQTWMSVVSSLYRKVARFQGRETIRYLLQKE
nr:MAG TPA: hypothetical protein [Crassvirales sp.]